MNGGHLHRAAAADDRFAAAWKALRADPSVQFTLPPAPTPAPPPAWLKALGEWLAHVFRPIGRALQWIGSFMPDAPWARILLWSVLAVAAAAILWTVWQRVRTGEWQLPRRRRAPAAEAAETDLEWTPDAAPAHQWLREADALAAAGRYDAAVHHLLLRSVEDIDRRRPRLVRPALTSRDLATAPDIPGAARGIFADLARLVERSLFGGRPVAEPDWTGARAAYAEFAGAKAWAR